MVDFFKWSLPILGVLGIAAGVPALGVPFLVLGLAIILALRPVDAAFDQATEDENPAGQVRAMGCGGLVFLLAIVAFLAIVMTVVGGV